jgi:serine/threonine protein kinase
VIIDSDISRLISKMLCVKVEDRFTIIDIKNHEAFLSGLPDGYILPTPIPIIPSVEPIRLEEGNANFLELMRN